jgi:hypothetical protein
MSTRPSHPAVAVAAAVVALVVGAGCGGSDVIVDGRSDSTGQRAETLDATVVYFDADGMEGPRPAAPLGAIVDADGLETFARRHVDGDPALGTAAADALADGEVLIGGPVSSGCSTSESGRVVFVGGDVRLQPVGLDEDPDVDCARAFVSVALMAVDPVDLPEGSTIQGVER